MGILSNVESLAANGISGGSVIAVIGVTLVSAVVLIVVCGGCTVGIMKLIHKLFGKHKENEC